MKSFRRFAHRAWPLHGYLIATMALFPITPLGADWRAGSVDSGGFHDFNYDDQNENQQWDEGETQVYLNSDSDNLKDFEERAWGTDLHNPDTDYDGLTDSDEAVALAVAGWVSSPTNWDTDGDGVSDHDEFWGCYAVNYITTPSSIPGWRYYDWDADGTPNYQDAYPFDPTNAAYTDSDGDGSYDQHDTDPANSSLWEDFNRNGINDSNETTPPPSDTDADGHPDGSDSHPNQSNLWSDWNGNNINDDQHSDADGVPDESDSHPGDSYLWSDWNGNGINDDQHSDADGVPDENDSDATASLLWSDWNRNGINDDQHSDNDGVPDENDSHPQDDSLWCDFNGNSINDTLEVDSDLDTVFDSQDSHPQNTSLWSDWNGNGVNDDLDGDGDGVANDYDSHPGNASLWSDWNQSGINDDQNSDSDSVVDDYDSDPMNGSLWEDWNRNGINDSEEPFDSDGDGYVDANDSDPNNYWLWEDWNRNGVNDSQDPPPPPGDSDGDGLTDDVDPFPYDPLNGDSDQDGLLDSLEAAAGAVVGYADTDGDGLNDGQEVHDSLSSPALIDTDGDGLTDFEEVYAFPGRGFSPVNAHSVSAQFTDWEMTSMTDTDRDGIPNDIESLWRLNPGDALDASGDLDGNGVSNLNQYQQGLALNDGVTTFDIDRDGMSDAWEAATGLNPGYFDDAVSDADADGVFAWEEYLTNLNPNTSLTFSDSVPVWLSSTGEAEVMNDWTRYYWTNRYFQTKRVLSLWNPFSLTNYGYVVPSAWSVGGIFIPIVVGPPPLVPGSSLVRAESIDWDSSGVISWTRGLQVGGWPGNLGTIHRDFVSPPPPAPNPVSPDDWDGDGMTNAWEYRYSLSLRGVDSSLDNDTDGLSNLGEFQFGSDPTIKSTDADGLSDFWEAQMGYNPRSTDSDGDGIPDDSEDYDGDGLANADELALGSNMLFDQWSAFNPVFGPIGPAVYSYDDANRLTSGAGDYYLDSEGNVKTQP